MNDDVRTTDDDDDEPSDRRPAALAVIGAMALFGAVCALGWVWP